MSTQTPIRSIHDDPEYAAAYQRLVDLRNQLAEVDRELQAIASGERTLRPNLDSEADRLLSGEQTGEPVTSATLAVVQTEHETLRHRKRVLHRAVEKAERAELDAARDASRRICEALLPDYRAIVQRMVDRAADLAAAAKAERDFREQLRQGDVRAGCLHPVNLPAGGFFDTDEPHAGLHRWLREAEQFHGITPSKDPRR